MDSKKSNKISEIVRLQQILKKWRKIANAPKPTTSTTPTTTTSPNSTTTTTKKFLKKTLSFKDVPAAGATDVVPKGFLAVCVGKEMKRFLIKTEYLGHRAFEMLLREAEEEFGFQNEGILRIPCEVSIFERILKMVEEKKEVFFINEYGFNGSDQKEMNIGCCSSEAELTHSLHPHPMCR